MFENKIIGFAGFGPIRSESRLDQHPFFEDTETKIGEIYAIYLLEKHKSKGLGKALFHRCRLWFSQHGFDSFVTLVLADNLPARRFYEKEGGNSIGEITITIGDKNYPELCYVFETQPS